MPVKVHDFEPQIASDKPVIVGDRLNNSMCAMTMSVNVMNQILFCFVICLFRTCNKVAFLFSTTTGRKC